MKFRSQLFWLFALGFLALAAIVMFWIYAYSSQENDTFAACLTACCWGTCPLSLALVFQLLAWRNAAGERVERRHREMLDK